MNRIVAISLLFAIVAVFLGTPSVAASKGVLAEDPTGDQTTWSLGRLVLRELYKKKGKKGKKGKKKKVRIENALTLLACSAPVIFTFILCFGLNPFCSVSLSLSLFLSLTSLSSLIVRIKRARRRAKRARRR